MDFRAGADPRGVQQDFGSRNLFEGSRLEHLDIRRKDPTPTFTITISQKHDRC
jgi:hypothetical protein